MFKFLKSAALFGQVSTVCLVPTMSRQSDQVIARPNHWSYGIDNFPIGILFII